MTAPAALSPPHPPGTAAPHAAPVADAVATELATLLYKQSYGVLFANFAVALPVLYVMREAATAGVLAAWIGAVYLLTLARVIVCRRFLLRAAGPVRPWVRGFCLLSWTSGLLWGLAGLLAVASGQDLLLAFGCVMLAGMCSGAVPSLSAYPPAYVGSALGMVAPFIGACLVAADGLHLVYAAFGVCLLAVNLYFSAVTYRSLKTTVALRFENSALIRSLEHERDRVAEADRAKTRFLAAAGHDLRQPVHALGMFTDILASRAEQGSVTPQDALHVARRQQGVLDGLNRLLDGLLDVSRLDAHLVRLERRAVALDALFDDIRLDYEPQARARGLRLVVAPTSLALQTDPALLRRILDNLLGNALSYTPAGWVLLSARGRRGGVLIQVWDTGVGIAPELRESVFTEFTRGAGGPAASPGNEGLGLGLAIVRRLTDLLHGDISLRSVTGKGSVFSLWLPARIPGAHAAGEK